jgi:hypothetical protein
MEQDNGRVPDGTGLSSPTEPQSSQGLGPSGFDPSRGDIFVQPGVPMTARTAYRYDGEPEREYWTVGDYDDGPVDKGSAEVEIVEVVATQHCGTLVAYRRRFIDPEGEPVGQSRRKVSNLASLRAYLKRWKFARRDSDGSPKGGDACGSVHDSAGPKDIAQ